MFSLKVCWHIDCGDNQLFNAPRIRALTLWNGSLTVHQVQHSEKNDKLQRLTPSRRHRGWPLTVRAGQHALHDGTFYGILQKPNELNH